MSHIRYPLVGIGLYTPVEVGCLIDLAPAKLTRWLRGYELKGTRHEPLWTPEVDLNDDKTYRSFRDLNEARAAARFIERSLSPQT